VGVAAAVHPDRPAAALSSSLEQEHKAAAFRALHEGEPFVIPNPWDAGSARVLEALGFKALATTSSGFAFTLGRLDGGVTLDEVLEHVRALDRVTQLPISVDLENGYGAEPERAATAVARAAEAGAVGGSIEDFDPHDGLYPFDHAVERVAAAVEAACALPIPFVLTARAENHIRGNPDLDDTIARLQAFERAGADVLYAPGLRSADQIRAVCGAVSKPVNVLATPKLSLGEIVDAGAQRISVGGALTWSAVSGFVSAAEAIRGRGDFSQLGSSARVGEWLGG
jgi:2-methylisocitrate lyase-like PEP mutase family enzyme